jgi:small subunit ribosomal protein S16
MKNGAVPSESVSRIFTKVGLLDRFSRFKKGEALEGLLAESKTAFEKHAAKA